MKPTLETAELLARIGREHELAEIDYEDASVKIHITFDPPPAPVAQPTYVQAPLAAAPVAASAPAAATAAKPAELGETIKSPLAGVFYRAPRPDSPSFVEEGTSVAPGQTLCIVEAMKLMNEITAERSCKILRILVENAEAVEEGQPLFVIA